MIKPLMIMMTKVQKNQAESCALRMTDWERALMTTMMTKVQKNQAESCAPRMTGWESALRMTTTHQKPQALGDIVEKDEGDHLVALRVLVLTMNDASVDVTQEHHQRTPQKEATAKQDTGSLKGLDVLRATVT